MVSLSGFNANEVEPRGDFEPLPAGRYEAVIVDSEDRETKAGTGTYLLLTFEILAGDHEGRKVWARLNLDNPNPKAVEIAKGELSALCRAVGVLAPEDSSELHDIPLVIKVKCRKRDDTGEITNEVAGYYPREQPKESSPPDHSTPPWRK